jgi:hypothetical protein
MSLAKYITILIVLERIILLHNTLAEILFYYRILTGKSGNPLYLSGNPPTMSGNPLYLSGNPPTNRRNI